MEMLRLIPTMMDWLAAILGRHDFFVRSRRVFGRGYGQRVVLKETNGCSPSEGVQDLVPSVRAPSKLMGVRFCLKAPSLGLVEREAKRKHHFFLFFRGQLFRHAHTQMKQHVPARSTVFQEDHLDLDFTHSCESKTHRLQTAGLVDWSGHRLESHAISFQSHASSVAQTEEHEALLRCRMCRWWDGWGLVGFGGGVGCGEIFNAAGFGAEHGLLNISRLTHGVQKKCRPKMRRKVLVIGALDTGSSIKTKLYARLSCMLSGIAGCSGCGKSTLAQKLVQSLGSPLAPVSLDWYLIPKWMPKAMRGSRIFGRLWGGGGEEVLLEGWCAL